MIKMEKCRQICDVLTYCLNCAISINLKYRFNILIGWPRANKFKLPSDILEYTSINFVQNIINMTYMLFETYF